MRVLVGLMLLATLVTWGNAQDVLHDITGETLHTLSAEGSGEVQGDKMLVIRSRGAVSAKFPLLVIHDPGITEDRFALVGRERHALSGRGYLEIVARFANGQEMVTRHADEEGPRSALVGQSEWREFTLPFYLNDRSLGMPVEVQLNVVLPYAGVVFLDELQLVQFSPGEDPLVFRGVWWSGSQSLLIGALLAALLIVLGAIVAALARRGQSRSVALALLVISGIIAVGLLAVGAWALRAGQPWHVPFPLLLVGGATLLWLFLWAPRLLRHFREAELRRMQALDAH